MWFLAFVAWGPALAGGPSDCVEQTSAVGLDAELRRAEDAFRAVDVQAFQSAMAAASASLPCVSDRITPSLAARTHRILGIQAFLDDELAGAEAAFAAARASDPRLTMDLVPAGHALELMWGQARVQDANEPIDPPEVGELFLDGQARLMVSTERPTVAQWIVDDTPRFTRWVETGAPLPAYPIAKDRGPTADARRRSRRRTVGLVVLGTGALTAVGAGALHAGAASSKASFNSDHPEWTRDDLNRVKRRTNTLGTSAGVVGVAALALGGVGVGLAW